MCDFAPSLQILYQQYMWWTRGQISSWVQKFVLSLWSHRQMNALSLSSALSGVLLNFLLQSIIQSQKVKVEAAQTQEFIQKLLLCWHFKHFNICIWKLFMICEIFSVVAESLHDLQKHKHFKIPFLHNPDLIFSLFFISFIVFYKKWISHHSCSLLVSMLKTVYQSLGGFFLLISSFFLYCL